MTDAKGRPINLFLTAGQTSDYIGARALLPSIPSAGVLPADRGYDPGWFRDALIERGITPCIPPRKARKSAVQYDKTLYRKRHRIENMFGPSRTGAASQPATTDTPTFSFPPAPSPPSYCSGCEP